VDEREQERCREEAARHPGFIAWVRDGGGAEPWRPRGRRGIRETCGGGGTIWNGRVGLLKCLDGS
jgi:hypothetical protein